jgi:NAD(P)-dependent dehydrogenase (short-subunit alcohol dehydrogenase family)
LATKLVHEGADVWIADRQVGPAEELACGLNSGGGKAHAIELDVRSYESFEIAVAEAMQESGRIDYLFNNAGIAIGGEIDSYTVDDWNFVFDVNLRGVVHGIQAVYPIMIAQHGGHIVNTASLAGLVAATGQGAYTASKHAVVGISKTLRVEGERHGVKVSLLCPGAVQTAIMTGGKYGRPPVNVDEAEFMKKIPAPLRPIVRPMAPDVFADHAFRAVLRGDGIIVLPAVYRAMWYLDRLSPALSMRMAKGMLTRMREMESTPDEDVSSD